MKIKQVCEATGLTDRAIRYYIEEGLAAPAYTENYMGRRAYDFSEADVTALTHVATLRKFGFTVEEIRRILADPQESVAIVAEVRARKEEIVRQESDNLDALSRLEEEKAYTVAELAEKLAEPVAEVEVPKEDRWQGWKERLVAWLKATPIWSVMLCPVIVAGILVIDPLVTQKYAHVEVCWPILAIGMLPTFVLGAMEIVKRFRRVRLAVQMGVLLLCMMYLMPFGLLMTAFSVVSYSETTDVANYMQTYWLPDPVQELFPEQAYTTEYAWQNGAYTEQPVQTKYYYYWTAEDGVHLYAEWALPPELLAEEVSRVEELLSGEPTLIKTQHGAYQCLIIPYTIWSNGSRQVWFTPFEIGEKGHWLTMFAYNEGTGVVRYIYCDWNESANPPHYMTLDWGEEAGEL